MFALLEVNHTLIKGNLILNKTLPVGLAGEMYEDTAFSKNG